MDPKSKSENSEYNGISELFQKLERHFVYSGNYRYCSGEYELRDRIHHYNSLGKMSSQEVKEWARKEVQRR